jgi:ATP-binding cassette, subfamily C (CFTR/MRP), member 1
LKKQVSNRKHCILILDKATSSLDKVSEAAIHAAVREEFHNDTIISVAHRLDNLRQMDTIVLLDKGKIVKVGAPAEAIVSTSE